MKKTLFILLIFSLLLSKSNAQLKLGVAYMYAYDTVFTPVYMPCFSTLNGNWLIDNASPVNTMYSVYPNYTFKIAPKAFEEKINESNEKIIVINNAQTIGFFNYQNRKFGEENNCKPLPICNKNNIKITDFAYEANKKTITKKLLNALKNLNNKMGNPITITDTIIKNVYTIRKINTNNYIIIASIYLDIIKLDAAFLKADGTSLFEQLSAYKALKKTLFILSNSTLKIITHQVEEIGFADFNSDGKKEMFLSTITENYKSCYLFCNNFKTLLHKKISAN